MDLSTLAGPEHLAGAAAQPAPSSGLDPAGRSIPTQIDELTRTLLGMHAAYAPLEHVFTPGLYRRTLRLPAGGLFTTVIHLTEHQYVVTQGRVSIFIDGEGWVELAAGHMGITKAGTRRVMYTHEDTVWTTFHANPDDCKDPDAIEARITAPHHAHLYGLAQPLPTHILQDMVERGLPAELAKKPAVLNGSA